MAETSAPPRSIDQEQVTVSSWIHDNLLNKLGRRWPVIRPCAESGFDFAAGSGVLGELEYDDDELAAGFGACRGCRWS